MLLIMIGAMMVINGLAILMIARRRKLEWLEYFLVYGGATVSGIGIYLDICSKSS